MRKSLVTMVTAGSALALALSGCSSKASTTGGGSGGTGDITTDFGVTDKDITLLQLTDHSGVFKVISLAFSAGLKIWVDEVNADGGICGRNIVENIQDTGYKVDLALPQYEAEKGKVLGISNLGGSQILAALKSKLETDQMMTVPGAWSSLNLDSQYVLMIGQTYDVEMLNGMSYLMTEGKIKAGDKIGHIYLDSEYGQNGLMGTQAFAKEHDMTIIPAPIASTDTDMTATITKFKAEGVTAIAVTTAPGALGSIALQNMDQGLNVPMIGSNPTFAPTLMVDAKVQEALKNFYLESSVVPFESGNDKADELLAAYKEITTDEPNIGLIQGYTWGLAWDALLREACDNGDLSRAGILAARENITSLDSDGLVGTLDFSQFGSPTTREGYILTPDAAKPGYLTVAEELFESEEAKNYKAPHQK